MRFASKRALADARTLTVTVHAYRRVQQARETLSPDLREAFDAIAVRRITEQQFARQSRITLDRARGKIAAAFALMNGELRLPPTTALIS